MRMKDVVGIVIQNGVVTNGTATGFYTYTTSQGATTTNWSSGFNYFLGGVTKVQNLAKPDYPVNSDYMFIKFQFTKSNEPAEALYGTYGHQVLTINISNPVFELSRNNGKLKPMNFYFGTEYNETTDYQSKTW
ncbi:hypothetical protein P9E76_10885 [Schinkia azotoformans]|nr:hypothetical protein [Schinkia azotoformans]MEC1640145.1 hypothetical protein [Schinkia azotoformans]MEC1945548.1 hypothetical protein [Schinkia azotoformans]